MQKLAKKFAIWATSYNFVGLYLCNKGMYRQSEKNLLSSNISSRCPHSMVNFGPLVAEVGPVVWGTPANFNGFRVLAALLDGTPAVDVSQTLWWPSRWALALILVFKVLFCKYYSLGQTWSSSRLRRQTRRRPWVSSRTCSL